MKTLNIKSLFIQSMIKIYFFLIIGFYPLAFMYKDEYQVVPIKMEGVLVTLLLGAFCNIGILMCLTNFGISWRKTTASLLLLSATTSWLIFYLPAANPTSTLSYEEWSSVRLILSYTSVGFVLFVICLLIKSKNIKK